MARDEWYPTRVAWWRNPKVAAISLEAAGLWAKARSYIADNNLSGVVPAAALTTIAAGRSTRKSLSELTSGDAPLWEPVDGGWYLHDFEDHEGKLEQRRRNDRDRQQRKRDASRDVTPKSRPQTKTETKTQAVTNVTAPKVETKQTAGEIVRLFSEAYEKRVGHNPTPGRAKAVGGIVKRLLEAGRPWETVRDASLKTIADGVGHATIETFVDKALAERRGVQSLSPRAAAMQRVPE